jgi:RimJ/RimL family protein N-acetyltransferase
MTDIAALYGLRLRTPLLELRLGSHGELVELGRLAEQGVHPPEEMPFAIAWSDRIGEPGFLEEFVAWHEQHLTDWSPESWCLNLLVWEAGTLVGTQGMLAEQFADEPIVNTGSWLGREHQRRGIGTEMRAAILHLAFAGLGARRAESSWLEGNEASRRVSEKLGYVDAGVRTQAPRGEPIADHVVAIEREAWNCPVSVDVDGLEPCLPLFGTRPRSAKPAPFEEIRELTLDLRRSANLYWADLRDLLRARSVAPETSVAVDRTPDESTDFLALVLEDSRVVEIEYQDRFRGAEPSIVAWVDAVPGTPEWELYREPVELALARFDKT